MIRLQIWIHAASVQRQRQIQIICCVSVDVSVSVSASFVFVLLVCACACQSQYSIADCFAILLAQVQVVDSYSKWPVPQSHKILIQIWSLTQIWIQINIHIWCCPSQLCCLLSPVVCLQIHIHIWCCSSQIILILIFIF